MPAISESYACASGGVAAGGRHRLPAWVPPLGTVADVSLNTAYAVGGSLTSIASVTRSWSGAAWAPWVGRYGKLFSAWGGHGDGAENALLGYDVESRLFYIEKPAAPIFHNVSDNYVADPVTGWMWGDTSGTSLQVGEPFTSHFYGFHLALPPTAIDGSDSGWLFTAGRGSMPEPGQIGTSQSHKYAIGNASKKWTMHGSTVVARPGHSPSIYDPTRNRVVSIIESEESATNRHPYIDLTTGETGMLTTSAYVRGHYGIGAYHSAEDCYMIARYASGALTFKVIDAGTLTVYSPSVSGTPPVETAEGAWDWVEAWGAWVYYPGDGSQNIYTLKCSGNPRGNNWAWGMQTVSGTPYACTVGQGAGLPYNRLRHCESLGVVLWFSDYNVPMQAFRINTP